jgi:putative SbcD/Mre11-related phosphoesterase
MDLRFVTGEPALLCGKALVISDLHMGIEYRYRKDGISMPSQSGRLAERIDGLIKKTGAGKLVIIGDIKHRVPGTSFQEEREIPSFFRHFLGRGIGIEVTPGNHDGGIGKLVPGQVRMHPSTGFMLGSAWLCHGHAWPGEGFLDAEHVVTGHSHAGIEFRDGFGYRWTDRAWVRAELSRKKLSGRYRGVGRKKLPEVIVMPPFSDLVGSMAVNRQGSRRFSEGPNPLFRIAKRKTARVYMLDGTFLGELGRI